MTIRRIIQGRSPGRNILWGAALLLGILSLLFLGQNFLNLETATAPTAPQFIDPLQYQEQFKDRASHVLLDVRTPEEFASGHISGAVIISVETLASRLDEIPRDLPVVVYCRSGNRSATAAQILNGEGFQPVYDLGGIQAWVAQGLPIE